MMLLVHTSITHTYSSTYQCAHGALQLHVWDWERSAQVAATTFDDGKVRESAGCTWYKYRYTFSVAQMCTQ